MEPWERDWITAGMAWVGLRRWVCGRDAGEEAWAWFQEQMELRFSPPFTPLRSAEGWSCEGPSLGCHNPVGRHITPDMERLLTATAKEIALAPMRQDAARATPTR